MTVMGLTLARSWWWTSPKGWYVSLETTFTESHRTPQGRGGLYADSVDTVTAVKPPEGLEDPNPCRRRRGASLMVLGFSLSVGTRGGWDLWTEWE